MSRSVSSSSVVAAVWAVPSITTDAEWIVSSMLLSTRRAGRLEDLDIDLDGAGERVGTEVRCQLEPVGGRDGEAGEAWIGHGVEASETARPTMRSPEQPLAGCPER